MHSKGLSLWKVSGIKRPESVENRFHSECDTPLRSTDFTNLLRQKGSQNTMSQGGKLSGFEREREDPGGLPAIRF